MRRRNYVSVVWLAAVWIGLWVGAVWGADVYVSPLGSDANPGTFEKPFASLGRAREAAAELKKVRDSGEIEVSIRGGLYELKEPVVFGPEDSGTPSCPIAYRAYPDEEPIFSGGVTIGGWRKEGEIEGVSTPAKGKLWVADVEKGKRFEQIYMEGKSYPVSAMPDTDEWRDWPVAKREGEELILPDGLSFRLRNASDVRINYLPTPYTKWINLFNTVAEKEGNRIRLAGPVLKIGILEATVEIPVRIENTLEGIDRAGEWCLDSERGRIWFWVPEEFAESFSDRVIAANLEHVIVLQGDAKENRWVEHIRFEGLSFCYGESGVVLRDARHCAIHACRVGPVPGRGVEALGDIQDVTAEQSLISRCGKEGIVFDGENLDSAERNTANRIVHNELHHCGEIHWQNSAVQLRMSGHNVVGFNAIHDMPYAGIAIGGVRFYILKKSLEKQGERHPVIDPADLTIYGLKKYVPGNNRIENNLVYDTMMKLDDGGAIYSHASHHNLLKKNVVYRTHRKGSHGLYFDDDEMFSTMENNLVYAAPMEDAPCGAILIHDNACNYAYRNIAAMILRPMQTPASYGGHVITQNVFYLKGSGCDQGVLQQNAGRYKDLQWDAGAPVMDDNLYWCTEGGAAAEKYLENRRAKGFDLHSRAADPGFADAEHYDFRFPTTSPVWQMGIEPIDIREAGIQSQFKAVKRDAN